MLLFAPPTKIVAKEKTGIVKIVFVKIAIYPMNFVISMFLAFPFPDSLSTSYRRSTRGAPNKRVTLNKFMIT